MAKQLMFDLEARKKLQDGMKKLADAVRVTLGPSGKNVILQKSFGSPVATKDGVTVTKEIELEDPFENMGAKLANEAASKTNDVAGDGTTTAALLTEAIYSEGLKYVVAGANPLALQRGLNRALATALDKMKAMSIPVKGREDYARVATVAAHNDRVIGDIVADAMEKVGKEGVITVEEGKSIRTELEFVKGMQFDKGYISPYFINKPADLTCELENPYILVYEKKISSVREIIGVLEAVAQTGGSLLVIAEEVEGEALALLVVNRLRGVLSCCAVKAPAFGDRRKAILEDIAILTGGKMISEDLGMKLENVKLSHLGQAKKVVIEKEKTTIVEGKGEKSKLEERLRQIRRLRDETTSDYDREKLEERLAKLTGGVAIIRAGAPTEADMKEIKMRLDDAVHAARAAAEEGILAGGGLAYLRSIPAIEKLKLEGDEQFGAKILAKALETNCWQLATNHGLDGSTVVEDLRGLEQNVGFNALTGKYENLLDAGIIEPLKVVKTALQNAVSIAGTLLSSRGLVTELKSKKKAVAASVK